MRMRVLPAAAVVLATACCTTAFASPSNPASIRSCLAKKGMTAKTHDATQVDASWRGNSVAVFILPSHDLALTFAAAGKKAGKPAGINVVSGSNLATFRRVPSALDLRRVRSCI